MSIQSVNNNVTYSQRNKTIFYCCLFISVSLYILYLTLSLPLSFSQWNYFCLFLISVCIRRCTLCFSCFKSLSRFLPDSSFRLLSVISWLSSLNCLSLISYVWYSVIVGAGPSDPRTLRLSGPRWNSPALSKKKVRLKFPSDFLVLLHNVRAIPNTRTPTCVYVAIKPDLIHRKHFVF